MKAVPQLFALSLLAISSIGVAALVGCAAPTVPSSGLDDGSGTPADNGGSAATKVPPKQSTSSSNSSSNSGGDTSTPSAPAASATTPPAAPTTPPPSTLPPTGTDPQACMDQCAATGVAAQYWSCSAVCQDQTCDDNCWNASCGVNSQSCETALDTCAQQCGYDPGGP
jgi:hypothetical protein